MESFIQSLQKNLHQREQNDEFSGVVRLTQNGQELFAGAYGVSNRPWQINNQVDTRFETASMTKLFTAVATLQLIDQGLLTFDTAVIPTLQISDSPISDDVTVFHLLTHSSGIADDAEEEAGEDYADIWKERPNYMVTETADFLPQFIHKPPNFPPGQSVRYNNVAFVLLGLLLEKVTGQTYRDYVRQHIFAPAGMVSSDFLHMADVNENVAEGYVAIRDTENQLRGWQRPIYTRPPIGSPDGGAYVTAVDMDRFWQAVRNGGYLSPALTEAFLTPQLFYHANKGFAFYYGYAVYFALDENKNIVFYLGEGEDNGVSCKSVYFPTHNMQAVMLANQDLCTWPLVWELYQLLSHDLR